MVNNWELKLPYLHNTFAKEFGCNIFEHQFHVNLRE